MSLFSEKQKQLKEQAAQEVIYEATLEVIGREKSEQLKMQDIAEAAGIATGTLYNYFKNKVELLTFVDEKLHGLILDRIEQVTKSALRPDEKLKSVVTEILSFCRDYHIVFDLAEKFGIKAKIPKQRKLNGLNHARSCIAKILSEGIGQQVFRDVETTDAARHFFSMIIGVVEIQSWLQDYEMADEADALAEFFMDYLKKQDGTSYE